MVDPDLLFELLPIDGEHVGFEAILAAVSEKSENEPTENELARAVFILSSRNLIDWLPDERQIRRHLANQKAGLPTPITQERDIEPWFERYLWLNARSFYDPSPKSLAVVVENTARKYATTGRWTRPDLSMACISRYRFSPVPQFDLYSFELKMPSGCNMLAVHEALSHRAAAHFAYLCIYLPIGSPEESNLAPMLEQAQLHGVGIIRMLDPSDHKTFSKLLEARRTNTSPGKIDGFIDDRFTVANQLALRRWVRI